MIFRLQVVICREIKQKSPESSRRSEWRASHHWNILDDFLENPFFSMKE